MSRKQNKRDRLAPDEPPALAQGRDEQAVWGWSKGREGPSKQRDVSRLHPGEKRKLRKAKISEKRAERASGGRGEGGGSRDTLDMRRLHATLLQLATCEVPLSDADTRIGVQPLSRHGRKAVTKLGRLLGFLYEELGSGDRRALMLTKLCNKDGVPRCPDEQQLIAALEVVQHWHGALAAESSDAIYELNDERKEEAKREKRKKQKEVRVREAEAREGFGMGGASSAALVPSRKRKAAPSGFTPVAFVAAGAGAVDSKLDGSEQEIDSGDDLREPKLASGGDTDSDDSDSTDSDDSSDSSDFESLDDSDDDDDSGSSGADAPTVGKGGEDDEVTAGLGASLAGLGLGARSDAVESAASLGPGSPAVPGARAATPTHRGEWEAHTSGFGSRLLGRLGYAGGQLGSAQRRLALSGTAASAAAGGPGSPMPAPLEAELRPNRLGLGAE